MRDHVLYLLRGGGAHMSFDDFIASFPSERCNEKKEGLPYTAWQVIEHMRIAQWDILQFCRDPTHVSPSFPEGYWPATDQSGNDDLWQKSVDQFRNDLKQMAD